MPGKLSAIPFGDGEVTMNTLARFTAAAVIAGLLGACSTPVRERIVPPAQMTLEQIAEGYVKAVLAYGELEPGYVDAYYGPAEWQTAAKKNPTSALALRNVIAKLYGDLPKAPAEQTGASAELTELRRAYLRNQIGALDARVRMHTGWKPSFDDESVALYDISAPSYDESDFEYTLEQLDSLLPKGPGTLADRYNRYQDRFAVPAARLDPVMRHGIEAARQATSRYLKLPLGETFELSFVKKKSWSAYNWYQGNLTSLIEINTDLPLTISRVITLAVHEGYPGHHVYNAMLEDQLVRGRGWPEFQIYALFSPQSFLAEGTADFGVGLAFPEGQRRVLLAELFRLAGFDPAEVPAYDAIQQAAKPLNATSIEAARRYRDGRMDRDQTIAWLQTYGLMSRARAEQRLNFIDDYGAYVINYSFGEEVVRAYVERTSGTVEPDERQWSVYYDLLSTPRTPNATFNY